MINLLQTQSIAWARGVQVALEAEGIRAKVLGEFDRGFGLMPWIPVRVVLLDNDDLKRAQAVVARLTPPRTGPPPSWWYQKRGLILLAIDFLAFLGWAAALDHYQEDETAGFRIFLYIWGVIVVLLFVGGASLIVYGPLVDKHRKGAS